MEGIEPLSSEAMASLGSNMIHIENILTPTSAGTDHNKMDNVGLDVDREDLTTNQMLEDKPFHKAAGIGDM